MAAFVRVAPTVSDRLLTCATQAARNVALPVSSPAAQVSKALEARPLINRLAVGLARKEARGAGHQWNLCSPPTNSQLVRVQNADIIDITAASQTHPSRQTLSSLTHLPNPH